jgi:nucleotide-binding universal stress UspA family protein
MRVLLATDGSEGADAATGWLAGFPLPSSTEVLVVSVAVMPQMLEIPVAAEITQAVVDAARGAAETACARLAPRWPSSVKILEGDPRECVLAAAEKWGADLIVVGARGLGFVGRLLLGSVSTAIVHEARCPVLVVKQRAHALGKIVLAIDGSPDSMEAAGFLVSLPLDPGVSVRLLAVVEPPHFPRSATMEAAPAITAVTERVIAERRAALDAVLASVAGELKPKVSRIERSVLIGRPGEEIIEAANETGVDLAIVGARGLGPIKRLLLGSISERVLRHAECAVLVVKGTRPWTAAEVSPH